MSGGGSRQSDESLSQPGDGLKGSILAQEQPEGQGRGAE